MWGSLNPLAWLISALKGILLRTDISYSLTHTLQHYLSVPLREKLGELSVPALCQNGVRRDF